MDWVWYRCLENKSDFDQKGKRKIHSSLVNLSRKRHLCDIGTKNIVWRANSITDESSFIITVKEFSFFFFSSISNLDHSKRFNLNYINTRKSIIFRLTLSIVSSHWLGWWKTRIFCFLFLDTIVEWRRTLPVQCDDGLHAKVYH